MTPACIKTGPKKFTTIPTNPLATLPRDEAVISPTVAPTTLPTPIPGDGSSFDSPILLEKDISYSWDSKSSSKTCTRYFLITGINPNQKISVKCDISKCVCSLQGMHMGQSATMTLYDWNRKRITSDLGYWTGSPELIALNHNTGSKWSSYWYVVKVKMGTGSLTPAETCSFAADIEYTLE
jgi:hypothetical protein